MKNYKLYLFVSLYFIAGVECKGGNGSYRATVLGGASIVLSRLLGWPMNAARTAQTNWSGTWHGSMKAFPTDQPGNGWKTVMEIGPYPMKDGTCIPFRSVMTMNGKVQQTKNNTFCRGRGADDLYINAGADNPKIAVRWFDDVLISSFKSHGLLAVVHMRMRGNQLEEEIVLSGDKPGENGTIVSLPIISYHVKTLRRRSAGKSG